MNYLLKTHFSYSPLDSALNKSLIIDSEYHSFGVAGDLQ